MTTVQNQLLHHPTPADNYDPDDVGMAHSPPLAPIKIKFEPSPSPQYLFLPPPQPSSPGSSAGSPDRKPSKKSKVLATQSDEGLINMMGNGMMQEIARMAGSQALADGLSEDDNTPMDRGTLIGMMPEKDEEEDTMMHDRSTHVESRREQEDDSENDVESVSRAIAAQLLAAQAVDVMSKIVRAESATPQENVKWESQEDKRLSIPSITMESPHFLGSPESTARHELKPSGPGELPPILQNSPHSVLSNGNAPITLPSISDQLGDISHIPEPILTAEAAFAQSPPGRPPPLFSAGHGSPPKSPNDFRRELPSPGRGGFYPPYNAHRRQSHPDGLQYSSAGDYSSSNTETPGTDPSGPPTTIDRMSIDGITNPQIGGFQCTYAGCNAQPFQTQYLLNSHANVHSSNRPHYCSVKGCPRSEGGKGFKRKNEMIRHGLVHDSPGYVCPFCPDREHKYPRPDNLQRHVRVHHVDKDKDDAQLREVLSQRPEGPSRGRRRRGGNS